MDETMPASGGPGITIILIDEQTLFRESLARALQAAESGFTVVALAPEAGVRTIRKAAASCDVVLVRLDNRPDQDGPSLAQLARLLQVREDLPLVLLSDRIDPYASLGPLRASVKAVMTGRSNLEMIVRALRQAHAGAHRPSTGKPSRRAR